MEKYFALELVGRENALEMAFTELCRSAQGRVGRSVRKNLIAIQCASGGGKTRFEVELMHYLQKDNRMQKQLGCGPIISLFVTYNSETPLLLEERAVAPTETGDSPLNPWYRGLVARVLYEGLVGATTLVRPKNTAAFAASAAVAVASASNASAASAAPLWVGGDSPIEFSKFFCLMPHGVNLRKAVLVVRLFYQRQVSVATGIPLEEVPVGPVVLLLDELIKSAGVDPDDSQKRIPSLICSEVGKCLDDLTGTEFLEVVSTLDIQLGGYAKKTPSERTLLWIRLDPLSGLDHMKQAIFRDPKRGTAARAAYSASGPQQRLLWERLLYESGGHPRSLEYILEMMARPLPPPTYWYLTEIAGAVAEGVIGTSAPPCDWVALVLSEELLRAVFLQEDVQPKQAVGGSWKHPGTGEPLTWGDLVHWGILPQSLENAITPFQPRLSLLILREALRQHAHGKRNGCSLLSRSLLNLCSPFRVWFFHAFFVTFFLLPTK